MNALAETGAQFSGADHLVASLAGAGVGVCFANPGTTEMAFVHALDRMPGMRAVLGLFEGVVSGAADGYARMAGRPAMTLLHMAPGLANAGANLHNARKAHAPILNIVGNHALRHLRYDAPLTADVAATASVFSDWVRTAQSAQSMARDAIEGLAVATGHPGRVATLIVPDDIGRAPVGVVAPAPVVPVESQGPRGLDPDLVARSVAGLGPGAVIIAAGTVLGDGPSLNLLAGIAAQTGTALIAPAANRRTERGAGLAAIPRIPYPVHEAMAALASFRRAILIEAPAPVAFFAWRDQPSRLLPRDCVVLPLAEVDQDGRLAVAMLADAIGARPRRFRTNGAGSMAAPRPGALTEASLCAAIAAALPEGAILIDEGMTHGRLVEAMTSDGPRHSCLMITGGAIGIGPPLAAGAAIACPDRPVVAMQADGSSMYTIQALWTQAREGANITTVIFANRGYDMLKTELVRGGANPGPLAAGLMDLRGPDLDFVSLARGMGVPAARCDDGAELYRLISAAVREPGPFLIEALL